MSTVTNIDFGPFLAVHDFIDKQKIPPSTKRLWGALVGFFQVHGSVYICRSFFAEKLKVRKETNSRATKALEKIGVLERTGKNHYNMFPIVKLKLPPTELNTASES